jgi:hypothetical protein
MYKFKPTMFLLHQTPKELDPKVELSVLEGLLKSLEKDENYEVAQIALNRINRIQHR